MSDVPTPNALSPTNEDTCGPYFPIYFSNPDLEDLTKVNSGLSVAPMGQHIILRGSVFDRHGDLANGIVMEFWQANAKGIYCSPANMDHPDLDPWFSGYGRLRSADGTYSFRTIMPGGVGERPPVITITLFSDGINRVVTQAFFESQQGNDSDPLLLTLPDSDRAKLIAHHDGRAADNAEIYRLDIILAGNGETPFFDDIES